MNETEEWKPVIGYQGLYEVSDTGKVKSTERIITVTNHPKGQHQRTVANKLLRPAATRDGYLAVSLWKQNSGKTINVHVLVASAFLGLHSGQHRCYWCGRTVTWPLFSKRVPWSMTIDHWNHNIIDNKSTNLLPSCNPCNAHRVKESNWLPWELGMPVGHRNLQHPMCNDGHLWTPDNTYTNSTTGSRTCKTCRRLTKRKWDESQRGV